MSERTVIYSIKGSVSKNEATVEIQVTSDQNDDYQFAVFAYHSMVTELRQRGYKVTSDPERE